MTHEGIDVLCNSNGVVYIIIHLVNAWFNAILVSACTHSGICCTTGKCCHCSEAAFKLEAGMGFTDENIAHHSMKNEVG